MVLFNYSTKELTAKVVYYGPGLCGKTTNLQYVHQNLPENVKGKMLSLATKTDRTLFFDFLPIDLGEIRGMKTRVQLYTVPGQVFYNETRKLVLKGADGIVFVADSQEQMIKANTESFKNLEENLKAHGLTLAEMPHVIQFNKRDLPRLASIEQMNTTINKYNAPFYESVATTGIGVQDTLKAITKLVLLHLTKRYESSSAGAARGAAPTPAPATPRPVAATPTPSPAAPAIPVAAASSAQGHGIPLSDAPARPAAVAASVPVMEPSTPDFDMGEIDDLVEEVQETEPFAAAPSLAGPLEPEPVPLEPVEPMFEEPPEPSASPMPPAEPDPTPSFEIDHDADPQWDLGGEQALEADAPAPLPAVEPDPQPFDAPIDDPSAATLIAPSPLADSPVRLEEVVGDNDLFEDPSVEVSRLSGGETREIIVPVEVGEPGGAKRRYKLAIQLRLDPVED